MTRNRASRRTIRTLVVFTVASLSGGLLAGAALGALGGSLPVAWRPATIFVLGPMAIGVAAAEIAGYRFGPPQRDRETPQGWLHHGPTLWALLNGLSLGVAATSRVGFWLWYAVPLGAFLSGDPVQGAALFGGYSVVRALGVWGIMVAQMSSVNRLDLGFVIVRGIPKARAVSDFQLLTLGVAVTIAAWPV